MSAKQIDKDIIMPPKELMVVASFRAKSGKEEAALKELRALLGPTREESGCVRYDLHRSLDDPGVFVFYEIWKNRQEIDQHLEKPYLQNLLAKVENLFSEPPKIDFLEKLD